MAHRVSGAQRVEAPGELGRRHAGLARERGEGEVLGLDLVRGEEVELGPVAGRDRDRLADHLVRGQLREDACRAALGQRQALAQGEVGGLVGCAEREQAVHDSSLSRLSISSPRVRSSRSRRATRAPMIAT